MIVIVYTVDDKLKELVCAPDLHTNKVKRVGMWGHI